MFTKHHPNGEGSNHLDNHKLEELIADYQAKRDLESLSEIVSLTQDRALTLIRFRKTARYRTESELLSDINFKLLKAVDKFDISKGSAFTFLSCLIQNTLHAAVSRARVIANQYVEFDEAAAGQLVSNGDSQSREAIDDLVHRVKLSARTMLSDPLELNAQRWFIESFLQDGFESRRHQCANAAIAVYGLSHSRSRELYDLTMLEVRRVLYDDLKRRQPIAPGRLLGTRLAWMARYANLMNSDEFTKFVTLMRNLAPYLLLIINPENRKSHRLDRNPAIGRRNVELIINGDPDAAPLFNENISDDKVTIAGDFS
jgi:hypothetical protein